MSNPFEFFNASDDEEDQKMTIVKKDDKPKLSTPSLTQPMPTSVPTRSRKSKTRRRPPRSLGPAPPPKPSPPKARNLASTPTWRGRRSSGSRRKSPLDTPTIAAQEPAESISLPMQGPSQKGWRRIRQRRQCQGHAAPRKIR